MKIEELSSTLDDKLAQADEQLQVLQQQRAQTDDPQSAHRLDNDIAALGAVHKKLLKSRAIAWRVHHLNEEIASGNQRLERQRRLGLLLIIISGVGLLGLGWIAWGMYF